MFRPVLGPRGRCWILILLTLSVGCMTERAENAPPAPPPPRPEVFNPLARGRLRVTNVGSETIFDLTVRFSRDIVAFGDVRVAETTAYHDVPNGVLHYAALNYTRNGRPMNQGVTDFMDAPQPGHFTYEMRFADIELGRGLIRNLLTIQKVIQDQ
jgi:hypothetical protein